MIKTGSKRFIVSLVIGLIATFIFAIIVVFIIPVVGIKVFMLPGEIVAPMVGLFIPSKIIYALVPAGGPEATVALFILSSFPCWWVAFTAASFILIVWRQHLKNQRQA